MRPDNVYQVRIEQRSRALGDGFLVDPGFVVTSAEAVRDAGPAVELRVPGRNGAARPGADRVGAARTGAGAGGDAGEVGAAVGGTDEVSAAGGGAGGDADEVSATGGGAGEVGAPGSGSGETVTAEVIEVRGEDGLALLAVARPGFRTLPEPAGPEAALDRPGHAPIPAPALGDQLLRFHRLGATRLRAELNGLTPGDPRPPARPELGEVAGGDERAALLLDHLRERARSGRLEPMVTVPGLGAGEGSR